MSVKTQGTQLYIIDPEATGGPEVLVIECATSIDGISAGRDQIEVTCLEDQARSYEPGLATPGSATVAINTDPQNPSHVRLHELFVSGTKFDMAIGWADGTAAPTLDTNDEFVLPTTRTFLVALQSYVSDYPFNFAQNAVVASSVTFQLSGFPTLYPKA